MDSSQSKSEVCFSNGKRVPVLETPQAGVLPEQIQAKALVLFLGNLDTTGDDENVQQDQLKRLFSQGFVKALSVAGTVIFDRAEDVGLARALGSCVEHRQQRPLLVCISDGARIIDQASKELDSEHDLFVCASEAGEKETQLAMAEAMADQSPDLPIIGLLRGGGDADKPSLQRVVRRGWPVITVTGSGGLADELGLMLEDKPKTIDDPVLGSSQFFCRLFKLTH